MSPADTQADTTATRTVDWPAANCLRIDVATVEAVQALRDAGVTPFLLKGPVIARWLYPDDVTQRPYDDADLLVAPDHIATAQQVLDQLGYRCVSPFSLALPHARPRHAECWLRDADTVAIDLHRTIHGTERSDPHHVWAAATRHADHLDLLGTRIDTPGEAFRLVHLVLHIRPYDQPGNRAWTDLDTALAHIPTHQWRAAATLADQLGVRHHFGALLRRTPQGANIAEQAGLPSTWPHHLRVEYQARTEIGRFLAQVLEAPPRHRLHLLKQRLFPPTAWLETNRDSDPLTPGQLTRIHIERLKQLLHHLPTTRHTHRHPRRDTDHP